MAKKRLKKPQVVLGMKYKSASRPDTAQRWWTDDGVRVMRMVDVAAGGPSGRMPYEEFADDVARGDLIPGNDEPADGQLFRRAGEQDTGTRWFRLSDRVFTLPADEPNELAATLANDFKVLDFIVAVVRGELVPAAADRPSVAQIDPGEAVGNGLPASGGDSSGNPQQMPTSPGMASATPSSADSTVKPSGDADGPASGDAGKSGTDGRSAAAGSGINPKLERGQRVRHNYEPDLGVGFVLENNGGWISVAWSTSTETYPVTSLSPVADGPRRPTAIEALRASVEMVRNDPGLQPHFDRTYKAITDAVANGQISTTFPVEIPQRERFLIARVLRFDGYKADEIFIQFDHALGSGGRA